MKIQVSRTFADVVQHSGLPNVTPDAHALSPIIAASTIVRFDNVLQYWVDNDAHKSFTSFLDFPCLAPPFPLVWLESRRPRTPQGPATNWPEEYGVVIQYLPADHMNDRCPPEVHWALQAHVIVDSARIPTCELSHPLAPNARYLRINNRLWFGELRFLLDGEGQVWRGDPRGSCCTATSRPDLLAPHDLHAQKIIAAAHAQGYGVTYTASLLAPAFLALCFMHCKNVTTPVVQVPPKFAKRHRKRHGYSPSGHRTINIKPMAKIVTQHMGTTGQTLPQALHICRGHFKDFSAGNGLFGRLRGRYWWNQQVRGTVATGTVTHDYTVSP